MSADTWVEPCGLSVRQQAMKRAFDLVVAAALLVLTSPLLLLGWIAAAVETRQSGIFRQLRVGRDGAPFELMKLRTMRSVPGVDTTVTTRRDVRITRSGAVMRRFKIDELPQLVNVLRGEMSLVGPRPDVPGFADQLHGPDRVILTVRPGITGPATLAYRDEESMLAEVADPERFNREVIWPDKVRINREYVEQYRLRTDLDCLVRTLRGASAPPPTMEEIQP
jgi:lipopolysaccharide/colanic/teichoic acid biosynthesis glycosyltransferase